MKHGCRFSVLQDSSSIKHLFGPLLVQKDEKIGKWSTYSEYGRLLSTGKYQVNKKTGKWIFYDEKGCKLRQQSYSEDIPNGKWVAYQANGKKQDAGCYKMLDKTGVWTSYDAQGKVIRKVKYNNGQEVKVIVGSK